MLMSQGSINAKVSVNVHGELIGGDVRIPLKLGHRLILHRNQKLPVHDERQVVRDLIDGDEEAVNIAANVLPKVISSVASTLSPLGERVIFHQGPPSLVFLVHNNKITELMVKESARILGRAHSVSILKGDLPTSWIDLASHSEVVKLHTDIWKMPYSDVSDSPETLNHLSMGLWSTLDSFNADFIVKSHYNCLGAHAEALVVKKLMTVVRSQLETIQDEVRNSA